MFWQTHCQTVVTLSCVVSRLLKYEGTSCGQVTLESAGFLVVVVRAVKPLVCRQMEDGSLISGSEDISSLFLIQTPSAKYQVGYSAGSRFMEWSRAPLLQLSGSACGNNRIFCPFLRIWAASFPAWEKFAAMGTASTEPSASRTWSQSSTVPGLCRGQFELLPPGLAVLTCGWTAWRW